MTTPLGFIYGLQHPKTGEIFYVGATQVSLKNRLRTHYQHLKECEKGKRGINKRYLYLQSLLPLKAEICLLELVINEDIDKRESFYIKKYRRINPNLTNMTDGGRGMCTSKYFSDEQKAQYGAKLSSANSGKAKPAGFKEHLSTIRKGALNPAARLIPYGGIVCNSVKLFKYGFEINDFLGTRHAYGNVLSSLNRVGGTAYGRVWTRFSDCTDEIQDIVQSSYESKK